MLSLSLSRPTSSHFLSLPRPLTPRPAAINPRRLHATSEEDGNEAMDDDSIAGDLGFAALAALKSDPPLGSSDKGGSAPLRGSDVLRALQRATARREKKKKRRFGRKEKSDGGEETTAIDGSGEVRPIKIRSDWESRIEELEMQVQRLLSLHH
ncbi:hypothetical protein IHE45_01G070800 [Dioscorea alata]|uniref:Uncharacterized protein n=1 Tax=Dioscorea alata TaxID=55571 RepID=A0ACB7WVY7_DIOAL|nr:hypothetical protein IHE45_01G070800 [Dioscorea alata]